MEKLKQIKDKLDAKLFALFITLTTMMNKPMLASANDGTVKLPKTNIADDGNVTFSDGGNVDMNDAVNKFISGGTRIFGWIIALAGIGMIIIGGIQAYKASKAIQEGNQQGWGETRNIILGLIVGGILFAIIGLMVGFGVGFGNSMFAN